MRMSFARASANVDLEIEVHNECGDGYSTGPGGWWDRIYAVRSVSWSFPLSLSPSTRRTHLVTDGNVFSSASADPAFIEQELGSTANARWRRARARRGATDLRTADAFERPLVAVSDAAGGAAIALGWMRFREPQALWVEESTLKIELISDPIAIGEAQARWNNAQLRFFGGNPSDATLASEAEQAAHEIERGLLLSAGRRIREGAATRP